MAGRAGTMPAGRTGWEARVPRRHGFTLLEVMLAVAIIGFTTVGIFRFVQSTVRAVAVSVEDTEEQLRVDRLVALVQEEFYSLPARGQTNIQGESIKLNGADFDSIEWRSRGGPGLMTTAVSGEYRVKLRIQPVEKNSNKYEIGYWRRPALLETDGGLVAGGSDKDATWVPLLQRVSAMRIRYWDSRLGQLLDSWRDPTARPAFVILSITREGDDVPYEAVLRIPVSAVQ
ncbi:MAG: prepilin-type N-terminal cleavage/methylation domain-containing protein [Verrucomicrobia bacterium]|nr:prepilin-type N-terminal cleavage/methylation domain-containing protein [Verrucomicrobiota bacterium]